MDATQHSFALMIVSDAAGVSSVARLNSLLIHPEIWTTTANNILYFRT